MLIFLQTYHNNNMARIWTLKFYFLAIFLFLLWQVYEILES